MPFNPKRYSLVIFIVTSILTASLVSQVLIERVSAAEVESVAIQVDMTDATKVLGTTLRNDAAGRIADLSIQGSPTMTASSDGFDFIFSNGSHLIGNIGSTSNLNKVVIEMTLKLKDNGNVNNSSGSMIFGFGTNSSSHVPYNIYHHSGFIGFNTFNSELYGVTVPDTINFYDYKFIMVKNSSSYTTQEIWINGVKQGLDYRRSGILNGISESSPNRLFKDGDYSNGDVTIMRHSLGSIWNASGFMKSIKVTTFNTVEAPTYNLSYNSNATQHQSGVVTGTLPSNSTHSGGSSVTVAANTGSLARQGFTFVGWNTQADGLGTTYSAGTGTFSINQNTTLYAKWEIPEAARLIGNGGAVITISNQSNVLNGTKCSGGIRGITTDGSYIYYRSSSDANYICQALLDGTLIAAKQVTGLSAIALDARDLTFSSNCIFIRQDGSISPSNLYCIDISDWTLNTISQPTGKELPVGNFWLNGNLIDFPDGRIGAVSETNQALTTGTGSGECPSGMYCKILRLYQVTGTGKNVNLTFSEDIVLADSESGWPDDDHGIATDGTYLYQTRFSSGYKVWALASGAPSYLVFNGSGSGACAASTGVSGTLCLINQPVTPGSTALSNATFFGRSHATNQYLMGDYGANKFYLSKAEQPPEGPGSASIPNAPIINSITSSDRQLTIIFTAGADGGATIRNYKYSTDGINYAEFSPADTSSPLVITKISSDGISELANGTTYSITIKAVNNAGESPASNAVSGTPGAISPATGGANPRTSPTLSPSATATQSPTPRRIITPSPNPSSLNLLPQISPIPTPSPTQTAQAGSPSRPAALIKKNIEEIAEVLKPRIIDLNTLINRTRSPDSVASANASSAVAPLSTMSALAQVPVPEDDKRVTEIPVSVLNNGVPEESRIVVIEETKSQVVTAGGGLLTVEAKAENGSIPVDSSGRVQMVRENTVEAEGQGLLEDSEFAVYLFSDPILLGIGRTDLAGRFFASFPVEKDLPLGDHTLQVVGVTPTGEQRTVSMPVVVVEDRESATAQALPQAILVDQNPVETWFESINYLLTLLLLLILVSLWVLYGAWRRRREEN